jgi:hypothetical protein
VHLSIASGDFHCQLDGELYFQESWSNDRARCRLAKIPDAMIYRPKTEIALELDSRAICSQQLGPQSTAILQNDFDFVARVKNLSLHACVGHVPLG